MALFWNRRGETQTGPLERNRRKPGTVNQRGSQPATDGNGRETEPNRKGRRRTSQHRKVALSGAGLRSYSRRLRSARVTGRYRCEPRFASTAPQVATPAGRQTGGRKTARAGTENTPRGLRLPWGFSRGLASLVAFSSQLSAFSMGRFVPMVVVVHCSVSLL